VDPVAPIRRIAAGDPLARSAILRVVNAAAEAYRPVLPPGLWRKPYMPAEELETDLGAGVEMYGWHEADGLEAVMGLQRAGAVDLIRHAYVRPDRQGAGLGSALLAHLRQVSGRPLLVGTWAAAEAAIGFYERRGFRRLGAAESAVLLARHWSVPADQAAASIVLAESGA
jgi:GNAT superfamily N-acetyltransferase